MAGASGMADAPSRVCKAGPVERGVEIRRIRLIVISER